MIVLKQETPAMLPFGFHDDYVSSGPDTCRPAMCKPAGMSGVKSELAILVRVETSLRNSGLPAFAVEIEGMRKCIFCNRMRAGGKDRNDVGHDRRAAADSPDSASSPITRRRSAGPPTLGRGRPMRSAVLNAGE